MPEETELRICILSDIHDNVWKLDATLARTRDADAMICCGDLCAPFTVHQLGRSFSGPIHIVYGNNDGDRQTIRAVAGKYPNISIDGEVFRGEFDGRKFGVNHYDYIAGMMVSSQEFDVVCYGHNHVYEVVQAGSTLSINPGPIMGAKFAPDGTRTDVASTFVYYDTASGEATRVEV
jgi:putative phosphoesterase